MNITYRWRLTLGAAIILLQTGNGPSLMASPQQSERAKQQTAQFRIAGMTCAACAKGLEASFRNMAGVVKADVDYKAGQAVVTFDATKQSTESLSKFVVTCGYKVTETKVV